MFELPPLSELSKTKTEYEKKSELNEKELEHESIISHLESAKRYNRILSIFNQQDPKEKMKEYIFEFNKLGIANSSEMKKAIENQVVDLTRYDTFVLSLVLNEFSEKESSTKEKKKPLDSYGIQNFEDLYLKIDEGIIKIELYTNEEIDDFFSRITNNKGGGLNG